MIVYAVPFVALIIGVLLGVFLARRGRWKVLGAFVLGVTAIAGVLFIRARGASDGWDAIAIFIPVVFLLAPVALGTLAGAAGARIAAMARKT